MTTFNIEILKNITILYVEDEAGLREQELKAYEKLFKRVFSCENGQEALEVYKQNQDLIDIIITDINMPKLSGLELAKLVKVFSNIPFILTTAYQNKEYLLSAIDLGIKKYITKPINIKNVVEDIQNVVIQDRKEKKIKAMLGTLMKESQDNQNNFDKLTTTIRKLQQDINIYKNILNNHMASIKINTKGIILDISLNFVNLFGYSEIELSMQDIDIIRDKNTYTTSFHQHINQVILKHTEKTFDISILDKQNKSININIVFTPIFYNNSSEIEYIDLYFINH